LSLDFLQLQEALGHPPSLKEFGESQFGSYGNAIAETTDDAYAKYSAVIANALANPMPQPILPPVEAPCSSPPKPATVPVRDTKPTHSDKRSEATKPKSWIQRLLGR
jgi:hypothetical protein